MKVDRFYNKSGPILQIIQKVDRSQNYTIKWTGFANAPFSFDPLEVLVTAWMIGILGIAMFNSIQRPRN
jgi:hypothetical protein